MTNVDFENKVLKALDALNGRFDWLETRFDWLETKVDEIDKKVYILDKKVDTLDKKVEMIDDKIDSRVYDLEQAINNNWRYIIQAFQKITELQK